MKMSRVIFALVCLAGLSQLVWSQEDAIGARGIPGYLNPKTGIFTIKAHSESADAVPQTTPSYYYGTLTVKITVYVASSFPAGTAYECDLSAGTYDGGGGDFTESVAASAAAPSGGVTSCTLSIPYMWQLSTPGTDIITFSFSVSAYNPTSTIGKFESYRSAGHVPVNSITGVPTKGGTVTTLTCAGVGCSTRL